MGAPIFPYEVRMYDMYVIVAIFYPFSQFCEIDICLPSLEKQPKRAPNLFQRGGEYGKWDRLLCYALLFGDGTALDS